jgi:hypothetical protein
LHNQSQKNENNNEETTNRADVRGRFDKGHVRRWIYGRNPVGSDALRTGHNLQIPHGQDGSASPHKERVFASHHSKEGREMKRSAKFKMEYQLYAQYAATWLFISIFFGTMAYAYNVLLVIPFAITICFTMRWFFDCLNKRRAYRMEKRYEMSRKIKQDTLSL